LKILKSDLDDALLALRKVTNDPLSEYVEEYPDYSYDKAYGGYRLVSEGGAREISPRLSKRSMYDWMWAYIEGIHVGKVVQARYALIKT